MRLVVTRPQADSERTAAALRARGHEVLVAPLMRVEPVAAEFFRRLGRRYRHQRQRAGRRRRQSGLQSAVQAAAVRGRPAQRGGRASRRDLPTSPRPAATCAIWCGSIAERRADASAPLLYLAGEDRAADLVGELVVHGIAAEMAVVYRAATAPFPPELTAALAGRRGRRRAAFFQAQRRELSRRRGPGGRGRSRRSAYGISACRRRSPRRSQAPAPAVSPSRRGRTRRR